MKHQKPDLPHGPASADNYTGDKKIDPIQDVITGLSTLESSLTPLEALQVQVTKFFRQGPGVASRLWNSISVSILNGSLAVSLGSISRFNFFGAPWNSCKLAATLVLVLASSKETAYEAVTFQSQSLGGFATLSIIRGTPTASLSAAFKKVKAIATGPSKLTTVIGVSLTDVHIFELAEKGTSAH